MKDRFGILLGIKKVVFIGTIFIFLSINSEESRIHGYVSSQDAVALKRAIIEKIVLLPKEHGSSDNILQRRGQLVRYEGARATIVICHGFMCDKHDVGFLRNLFQTGFFNIVTFDFRAHGEDIKGQTCTFGPDEAYDVLAAGNFAKNHPDLQGKPLFVYGFSMGAVAALQAQLLQPGLFDGMILDCPFASTENVIKQALSKMKISLLGYEFEVPGRRLLEKYAFHPYVQGALKIALKAVAKMDTKNIATNIKSVNLINSMHTISVPCFFIYCKNDEKIPVDDVRALYNASSGHKWLWITEGRNHYDSFFYNPEKYIYLVKKFLNKVMKQQMDEIGEIIIED